MNNQQSAFQQKYPLSPRKFWKKVLPKAIFFGFVSIFISFFVAILSQVNNFDFSSFVFIFIAVAIFCFFFILLPYAWYISAYIKRYYYEGGNDFITIKKGVFTPTEIHVQYQKIQDVYVDQDLLDRMMGLYDVHIASATSTSGIEAHIDGVDETTAEGLKEFFLNKIKGGTISNQVNSTAIPQQSQPIRVNLSEVISNETYPINPRWYIRGVLGSIIAAIITVPIIFAFVFSPGKNGNPSLAQSLGWSTQNVFPIAVIIAVLYALGLLIYNIVWGRNFKFQFLPEYIYMYQQFIGKQEKHVPYNTIQDVVVKQGIIERLFGLSTVYIQNATDNNQSSKRTLFGAAITIPGQTPESANKLAEIVRSITLSKDASGTGL